MNGDILDVVIATSKACVMGYETVLNLSFHLRLLRWIFWHCNYDGIERRWFSLEFFLRLSYYTEFSLWSEKISLHVLWCFSYLLGPGFTEICIFHIYVSVLFMGMNKHRSFNHVGIKLWARVGANIAPRRSSRSNRPPEGEGSFCSWSLRCFPVKFDWRKYMQVDLKK